MGEYQELAKQTALFLFRPGEWHVLIIMALVVTALTETIKRAFLAQMKAIPRRRAIYLTAVIASVLVAIAAWATHAEPVRPWFWWVAGISVGPITNFLHWATLGLIAWKWPGAAAALKGVKR